MLILVTGLPGSGKSKCVDYLKEYLNIHNKNYIHYSTDTIRNFVFQLSNHVDRDFTHEELNLTYQILYQLISGIMGIEHEKVLIVDGFFRKREQREKVKEISQMKNIQVCHFLIETNEKLIVDRVKNRFQKGMGPGIQGFLNAKYGFEEIINENVIRISNDGTIKDLRRSVITEMQKIF